MHTRKQHARPHQTVQLHVEHTNFSGFMNSCSSNTEGSQSFKNNDLISDRVLALVELLAGKKKKKKGHDRDNYIRSETEEKEKEAGPWNQVPPVSMSHHKIPPRHN